MTLDAAVGDYRRQGYCILPDGLRPAELDSLTAAANTLLEEAIDDGGGRHHDIGRGESRRFLRLRHEDFPAVEAFLLGERMRERASGFIGPTPHLFVEQFVVKGAEGRRQLRLASG